jgi:hypothetical protein
LIFEWQPVFRLCEIVIATKVVDADPEQADGPSPGFRFVEQLKRPADERVGFSSWRR